MILPWIELIKNHGLDSAPVIILANKYDKEDEDFGSKELPKISKQLQEFLIKNKMRFSIKFVSAKTGNNIEGSFNQMIDNIENMHTPKNSYHLGSKRGTKLSVQSFNQQTRKKKNQKNGCS